jgi:hypothetical protein
VRGITAFGGQSGACAGGPRSVASGAQRPIVSFRKLPNGLVRQASLCGGNDARAVIARLDAAYGDIVRSGEVIAHEILKDDANVGAHREQVVLAQIMPVEQNAAARGRVS